MNIELIAIYAILIIGWPVLIMMSILIIKRGCGFCKKLKGTILEKLMKPTVIGWIYGMFMLGIVSTAYMLKVHWYYAVIPAFLTFLIAITVIYIAIKKWEKEAIKLQAFYNNLEKLVKERTKKLEKAHEKQIRHEKEIQKLKDQFVFIAAHELKTPVTAIRWGIETALSESKGMLKPEVETYLNDVQASNLRLIRLVDDLLNVARIEAGTIKIEPREIKLNDAINDSVRDVESLFKEKSITLKKEIDENLKVIADPERVKQVLINLLSNAIKYNREKGKIIVETSKDANLAVVSVSDTGIGIEEKDMIKLFTKFCRIESNENQEIEGTGLGLFVSKQIVEKMGGSVFAKSKKGIGSTFGFTIPLKE